MPISAAEVVWTEEDAAWERLQAEAAAAGAAGDHAGAAAHLAQGLRLARTAFDPDDPRLAASLVNHALALRRDGEAVADRLLEEAVRVWDRTAAWLARQPFARRARSSMFHLRLEARHPGAYDANLRRRAEDLLRAARGAAAAIAAGAADRAPDPHLLGVIRGAPPDAMRKVLAAVHLQAAPRPSQDGS